jgi:hypothetical protein
MWLMAKKGRKSGSSLVKTKAGHKVRSQSEAKIDDWLFSQRFNFVYEPIFWMKGRKIEPDWVIMPSDVPSVTKPIIIEYWGLSYSKQQMKNVSYWVENAKEGYEARRNRKESFYGEQESYDYIGITPEDLNNLKQWLPQQLKKLGVDLPIPQSQSQKTSAKSPHNKGWSVRKSNKSGGLGQKEVESILGLTLPKVGNQRTQDIRKRLPDGWNYFPQK